MLMMMMYLMYLIIIGELLIQNLEKGKANIGCKDALTLYIHSGRVWKVNVSREEQQHYGTPINKERWFF